MAVPTTRTEFKDYCLRRLGFPVIDINVDEDQVEDRIDDALTKFADYHYDGVTDEYLAIPVTSGDIANSYVTLPSSIIGVRQVLPINGTYNSSSGSAVDFNIFDLNYQLRLNELYDFTSSSYTYYYIARSHIRMLEMLLTGEAPLRFNKKQQKLYVDMSWEARLSPGGFLVVQCQKVLDPTEYPKIWSDNWLKGYATQLIKKQWGANLTKYDNYVLPGGMVINGKGIYAEAVEEIAKLEEELRDTYELPPMFDVG
jgi:hypothetical protein